MDHHHHHRFVLTAIAISFFFILINLPQSHCEEDNKYTICSRPYNCGQLTNISYPFWGDDHNRPEYCGGGDPFKLDCSGDTTSIQIGWQRFLVYNISTSNYTMNMTPDLHDHAYEGYENSYCSPDFVNITLDPTLFRYTRRVHDISIFMDCPSGVYNGTNAFKCPNYEKEDAFYVDVEDINEFPLHYKCNRIIQVPSLQRVSLETGGGIKHLEGALSVGFEVNYTVAVADAQHCKRCMNSNGTCGVNEVKKFTCYCPDGSDALDCYPSKNKLNMKRKIIIGVGCAGFGALVVFIACYLWYRRKKNSYAMSYMQSRSLSSDLSLKDTEKGSLTIAPGVHLFSYTELEEATNYFDSSRELGEGGFGTVYFGKLPDGRCVAVKRLYENNYRRVEQFMNEIKILTRLVHPNLVTLYGCTSRHSRELLLVYEYVPNGTVADHLHGERTKPGTLPWHIRMNIAVETASALKYLHASDIIHRDVKTNNILLDSHFRVKVADFGLSRLFPNDVTHISTAPQGTPGYLDPEYHECYQLTSKSDVYSFGVVLIELISSLPAVDITRHRHEINLANMAINKIHNQALHELVDPTLGFESDEKVRKMINAVAELGFQCLQSSNDMRPSMEEVLDTLKDIQSGGKPKSQPEVMDISSSAADDVVLLKDDPPPPSPDSNAVSKSTTPNASG